MFFNDLAGKIREPETVWRDVHDQLARELAVFVLSEGKTYEERCGRYLAEQYDLWQDHHGTPDHFFKTRISLVELALRRFETAAATQATLSRSLGGLLSWKPGSVTVSTEKTDAERAVGSAVAEINARLRNNGIPLTYHAGLIQLEEDDLTSGQIQEPTWSLIADAKWSNVATDLKEAIHRRDTSARDSAFYALRALESAIKIVSNDRGWTRGTETGAAHYVDNLVSASNGRFIDPWEADQLRALFKHLRNPLSHGPGSAPEPTFSLAQQTWILDSVMAWLKSLLERP